MRGTVAHSATGGEKGKTSASEMVFPSPHSEQAMISFSAPAHPLRHIIVQKFPKIHEKIREKVLTISNICDTLYLPLRGGFFFRAAKTAKESGMQPRLREVNEEKVRFF